MRNLVPTWRVAARHGISSWRLLSTLALGILVAAILLASAPIYSRAMADLGLTFAIRQDLEGRSGVNVELLSTELATEDGANLRQAVGARIDERIGWFRSAQERYLRLGRLKLQDRDAPEPEPRAPEISAQSLTGYEARIRVVEGTLPAPTAPGEPLQLAMSTAGAAAAGLTVGDEFALYEDSDTCERIIPDGEPPPPPDPCDPAAAVRFTVPAVLTAIIEPIDAEDTWWVGGSALYFEPQRPHPIPDAGPRIPAFTTEQSLVDGFGALHPGYRVLLRWHVFANAEGLNRQNFSRARDDLLGLRADITRVDGFAYGPLLSTLEGFGSTADYQQTPLTVLLLQVAAVALFYVGLIAATVVERQSTDITLLRSRGASAWQITSIYVLEGLVISAVAVLVAPLLAGAVTALLGLTPAFEEASGGDMLPVSLPPLAFLFAAVGALLGVLSLALPVLIVSLRGALAHRRGQSRPGVSFIQRYYLDLMFAGLAGLLLWELNERGSVFEPSATGGVSSDPVLLASPALIIAAAAALILRFYPLVLRVVVRLVSAVAGLTVALGFWQIARSPGQYTRLALLLMMAIAVGTYAASYSSTADRSYRDRANFEAGVEFRASTNSASRITLNARETEAAAAALPGVERAAAAYRVGATVASQGASGTPVQALALPLEAARDMLWFRDDLADRPLGELLNQLTGPSQMRGLPVPSGATALTIWVNPPETAETITLRARIRDGQGQNKLVDFGEIGTPGWRQLTAPLTQGVAQITPPFRVISLEFFEPPNLRRGQTKPILLDDLAAETPAGAVLLDGFENVASWSVIPAKVNIADEFVANTQNAKSGRAAGQFRFTTPSNNGNSGLYVTDPMAPLPALVSDQFLAETGSAPGRTLLLSFGDILVPVIIRDRYELFPTLPSSRGASIVLNRDHVLEWLDAFALSDLESPNELWFTLEPGADREALRRELAGPTFALEVISDREERLDAITANPLIVAGGSGILTVAFLAVLFLVGAALLVSLWMAVQRRRVEFAVLRALGTSRSQVFRLLALEYAVVVVVGLVGGGFLGLFVSRRMLSFLNVTEGGARVEPEFILQTNWAFVGAGAGAVLIVFALALVAAVRVLSRISDGQALRTE